MLQGSPSRRLFASRDSRQARSILSPASHLCSSFDKPVLAAGMLLRPSWVPPHCYCLMCSLSVRRRDRQ